MKLFRITKQMPDNWFNDTHRAITQAETHTDLCSMQTAIEADINSFYVSNKDKAAMWLLLAYCRLRYRLLTNQIERNNYSYNNK